MRSRSMGIGNCLDDAQIDAVHATSARTKTCPCRKRLLLVRELQSTREIVSTATWHNEHRKLQLSQTRQVTMNGSIPTENQNGICVRRACGYAGDPLCIRVFGERAQVFFGRIEPEDNRGAHQALKSSKSVLE